MQYNKIDIAGTKLGKRDFRKAIWYFVICNLKIFKRLMNIHDLYNSYKTPFRTQQHHVNVTSVQKRCGYPYNMTIFS